VNLISRPERDKVPDLKSSGVSSRSWGLEPETRKHNNCIAVAYISLEARVRLQKPMIFRIFWTV
jgi:hypothetical protein